MKTKKGIVGGIVALVIGLVYIISIPVVGDNLDACGNLNYIHKIRDQIIVGIVGATGILIGLSVLCQKSPMSKD